MLTVEEVRKAGWRIIKYVRVAGEYRFCSNNDEHRSLIQDREVPLSAGTIIVMEDYFKIVDRWSSTLGIGSDEYDGERLSLVLRLPYKEK